MPVKPYTLPTKGKQTVQHHENMTRYKGIPYSQVSTYNGDSWHIAIVPTTQVNKVKAQYLKDLIL